MNKVLVVGYGSIARKHISNIQNLKPDSEIAVLRSHSKQKVENTSTFFNLCDALSWKPQAVFITSPASMHISHSLAFAEMGCHLYIEKPLSVDMNNIDKLSKLIKNKKIIVKIGYNLRHLQIVNKLKNLINENSIGKIFSVRAEVGQWLPDWRPDSDYAESVTAKRNLGGGAVLELSHEIDYLRYVFGEIKCLSSCISKQSGLTIDVEDNVEAWLIFKNGIQGSLHLDLLRRDKCRKCTVIGREGSIEADLINSKLRLYEAKNSEWSEIDLEIEDTYAVSQKEFFDSILSKRETSIPLIEGIRSLTASLAIIESSTSKRRVSL